MDSERSQLKSKLRQLQEEVEASQQAIAALQDRNLTGEALLSKVNGDHGLYSFSPYRMRWMLSTL